MANNLLPTHLMACAVSAVTGDPETRVTSSSSHYTAFWKNHSAEFDQGMALLSLDEFKQRFAERYFPSLKEASKPDCACSWELKDKQ